MSEVVIETDKDWSSADSLRLVRVPLPLRRPAVGVNFHGLWDHYWSSGSPTAQFHQHMDSLRSAGVSMLRVDMGADRAMPASTWSPNSSYNLRVGKLLVEAKARGMKVLVALQQSPEWTRPGTGTNVKQYPTDLVAWKSLCSALAAHWGEMVHAWQVWNEPNLSAFTGVSGDSNARADKYVPVLKASFDGIRAGSKHPKVVFGGPSLSDNLFIDACYWRGAKDYFDVMAWHPYQGDETKSPFSADLYDKTRVTFAPRILEHMAYWERQHADKPIWWTELGVSVHSNDGIPANEPWRFGVPTPEKAAEHLLAYLELAKRWPQVEYGFVYVAHKTGDVHQAGYSIMQADGTLLPQLDALKGYTLGTLGF
jgi:Cellulase (glycosyl hydrolase family 5)